MAGEYTEITELLVASEAAAGSFTAIRVTIKNTSIYRMGVMVGAWLDYGVTPWSEISFSYNYVDLNPGESHTFDGAFMMPDSDVTIHAYSYWYGDDYAWHPDDEVTKKVSLTELVPTFSEFGVTAFSKV